MNQRDLSMVLGVVADVSRWLGANGKLEVWTGDTHVASVQKVFRREEIRLVGGGGTDMRAMILSAMKRRAKPPEVILVATDGITPWPEKPVEAKVMACLTRKCRANRVPAWIETVVLRQDPGPARPGRSLGRRDGRQSGAAPSQRGTSLRGRAMKQNVY